MMRGLAGACALIATAATATGASAGEWWQGVFAWDKAWCDKAAAIGRVTPAPIAITATEVLGYENSCRILQIGEMRAANAISMQLECQSEGARFREQRVIMKGQDSIWMWFGADEPMRFYRCPDAPLSPLGWKDRG